MQATITLEYNDSETAAAVTRAILPDNSTAPNGLTVDTVLEGSKIVTQIRLTGNLATLIATIDDLLESISSAERVLQVIGRSSQL